jgi:AmmeMemoRadiSam system protein B
MSERIAGVRGKFYPRSCAEIEHMIKRFNAVLDENLKDRGVLKLLPKAIISPHAGYIYSGFTANFVHRISKNNEAKRVVVIGPSHHVHIEGVSGSFFDTVETPCGDMEVDKEYLKELKEKFNLTFVSKAHELEHSTETQFPFIKEYHPSAKVVELIYGRVDYREIALIIDHILSKSENLLIISTDLSHFYTKAKAKVLDSICIEGVVKKDIKILNSGCEACGIIGVKGMVEVARIRDFDIKLIDYRTSADTSGDESSVVGYGGFVVL